MLRRAQLSEADAITHVINAAFGPAEASFIDTDRITADEVRELFEKGVFLILVDYAGCVYVELRGERAYLGLLSVDPARQGSGLGKRLVSAAEDYALARGCRFMYIRVVNLRTELLPMYGRWGYVLTGTEPWPEGVPSKLPCHMLCMAKELLPKGE